ncbi:MULTISPECIES: ArsR/SmtB family transcription factor [Bifidobacterium]|jgi:DNA-binding transcriptional ArsR family regulator|nr:winged helix-turn-helix domain-containing protein [Bifidobacterium tibiigranuli]MCH3975953.1 winged helix-turn-helix domain-containing protein [Bifidobacterium tibiigranuli]MCH4190410.1 winged helix-turn-helix domain-containing protein [Bifidobacterium tibiigranuli]MCI1211896.1 winged helix-turn-helix domain-containing protein [Bifidobacterium tibiigranuli]MCI1221957.1 winged helix-turn-helix domain-containing protein [Bifidobacterium tibiigranuli]MCI1232511.1 winged helix-turn-helix domain
MKSIPHTFASGNRDSRVTGFPAREHAVVLATISSSLPYLNIHHRFLSCEWGGKAVRIQVSRHDCSVLAEQSRGDNGGMSNRVFPEALPDIAASAAVLADPSRAAMCAALMDGRAWTVGELGAYTGLARSTASEHVDVLVGCGLAAAVRQGRHRYIRLAGEDVANVIEALGVIAGGTLPTPPSLRAWTANKSLREGRTCYRHLAGALGVRLSEQLEAHGFIDDHWQPTASGIHLLDSWGILTDPVPSGVQCMDSTERRFHLAGPLGTAICQAFFAHGWVARLPGNKRAAQLTPSGSAALRAADLNVDQHSDS